MDIRKAGLAMAMAAAWMAPAWAQSSAQSSVAQLRQVNGNVLVSRETGMATGSEAQQIMNGSRIITTANSRVVVVFDNGCRVEMEENQRLDVDSRKPCAALLPISLGVAPAAVGVPLANYIVPGLIIGGTLINSGGGTGPGPTPVSPN